MLQKLVLNNYRCFHKVDAPLRELTVLVGPNDTGKTAFLDALQILTGSLNILDSDFRLGEKNIILQGHAKFGIGLFQIPHLPKNHGRPDEQWLKTVNPVQRFLLPSSGVALTSSGSPDEQGPPRIEQHGDNVPALLDYLLRRDRQRFYQVVDALRALIPGLKDVDIATPNASQRQLVLVVENDYKINADLSSTGVRFLIFFVALAFHPYPPKIILLEEPETGIHPKRLADVMKLMRSVTKGVHGGYPAQVIMTTHSPYLLDLVDLEQDQVLVFKREEDGSRSVTPADPSRLKNFLDEFMLGEVWYNEGENGLLTKQE